ncbi:thioredoxin family protein [Hyunsoonleella aestuarii]|uniref:Thioredoxin domain-containing protein n=1 Tax=Hyunsoonleella aestuarii TaxID=912802 RepID=A0ABP8E7V4_9FLAO|nr:thioredoxin family protein [Hyunsoonleella aestuarii]
MKKTIFGFLIFIGAYSFSNAQKAIWHTDMTKASEIAINENKPVLMFFTGSDWCGWCKRLQREVLLTEDFEAWAKDNVVLMELDFPRRAPQEQSVKVQNYQLQQIFKVTGYPKIFFVNPEKKPDGKMNLNSLGSTGYVRGGTQKWLAVANNIIKK